MRTVRKILSAAFICLTALSANLVAYQPAFAGGAGYSCGIYQWNVSGGGGAYGIPNVVNAYCRKIDGSWQWTSAWLPGYLGNSNGNLVWSGNGYYDRSCKASFSPTYEIFAPNEATIIYYAQCANYGGNFVSTSANMNEGLSNQNGNLGW